MKNINKYIISENSEYWENVFNEVTLNKLPIDYVEKILITFKDGKSWEIEVSQKKSKSLLNNFENGLSEILSSYKEHIDHVDVKINTDKVKKEVEKSINLMLNKIKL